MGFKLPGKSIQTGTSGHSSALKMVTEQRAASALKARQETESPVKASEFGAEYRKNRDAGKKYFTYKDKEYTTESRSEKTKRDTTGKTYAELNPKKSMTKEFTANTEKVVTSTTGDETDNNSVRTTGKDQNASSIDSTEKESKESVVTSAKADLKDTKKQNKINTLKAKKDVADTKGKSKRSQRLANKIERKESRQDGDKSTNVSRKDQRTARKAKKEEATIKSMNAKIATGAGKGSPKSYQDKKKEKQSSYNAAKDKEQARFDGKQ